MRTLLRSLLMALLVVTLIETPAVAAPEVVAESPLGVVLQADRAMVGTGSAVNGATVFDGDQLQTDNSGMLRVRFGTAQAYLLPKSSAVVHRWTDGYAASLTSGTVVVSSAKGESFRLLADGATIQPDTSQATVAQVTLVSATELLLTSSKGVLEVSMGNEVKTVAEGTSTRMLIQPSAAPGSSDLGAGQTTGTNGSGSNSSAQGSNKFVFVVIGAIVVATVVATVLALETNP
jgi:hypothetical protein